MPNIDFKRCRYKLSHMRHETEEWHKKNKTERWVNTKHRVQMDQHIICYANSKRVDRIYGSTKQNKKKWFPEDTSTSVCRLMSYRKSIKPKPTDKHI